MALYQSPQAELLAALINQSNPGLNISPLTIDNCDFSTPITETTPAGDIGDTSVLITPRPHYFFKGPGRVTYRRIDLGKLFAFQVINYERWQPTNLTRETLVGWLNRDYGLSLLPENLTVSAYAPGQSTVTIAATSLCYQGSFTLNWVRGKRDLDQIIDPQLSPVILTYTDLPIDLSDPRPILTHLHFGYDFTPYAATLNTISGGTVINGTTTGLLGPLKRLKDITGVSLDVATPHAVGGGLNGLTCQRYLKPFDQLIDADPRFNRVLAIGAEPNSWFSGRLLLHYN